MFSKGVGVIKKLFKSLPRNALLTIYKSFVRPHLDYGNIVYDQPNNESFISKLKQVQYNAALAITGAIKCASRTELYNELQSNAKYLEQSLFLSIEPTKGPPPPR